MSFWRTFGFTTISPIETILDREHFTLEELLDEEELLQECKTQNKKLLDFLTKPEILDKLVDYLTIEAEDLQDTKRRFKYPFLSCEILCCEVWAICEAIYAHEDLLNKLYGYLDKDPPLNPLLASYVSRVAGVLLQRKIPETLNFLKQRQDLIQKFINHLGSSAMMDLLLKVIGCEQTSEGKGVLEWLCNANLIPRLVAKLDPTLNGEVHDNVAQALVDIITVSTQNNQTGTPSPLIVQLESEDSVKQILSFVLAEGATSSLLSGLAVLIELLKKKVQEKHDSATVIDQLPPLLRVIVEHLDQFKLILENPPNPTPIQSTIGEFQPLGFYRLRIVEFIVSLTQTNISCVSLKLLELNILNTCLDLFAKYEFNNFLHATIQQLLETILNSDNQPLKLALFTECKLLDRILRASQVNTEEVQKEKGTRKGYMGFLTAISVTILNEASRNPELTDFLNKTPDWSAYVENSLNPTRQVENTPLGGQKPLSIAEPGQNEEEEMAEASAQAVFTQYLAQQGFPTSYQDLDDDDDDDDDEYEDEEGTDPSAFEADGHPFNRNVDVNTNEKETFQLVDDDQVESHDQ